jgi:hypothetical protein
MRLLKKWPTAFSAALKLSSLSLIVTLLSGCANGSAVNSYCLLYEPIYHGEEDSEDTRGQIDRQNAIWLEVCDE